MDVGNNSKISAQYLTNDASKANKTTRTCKHHYNININEAMN